jgi:SAM-dependent methyltransferase
MKKEFNSKLYWQERYMNGGISGAGSRGQLADFKADVLNQFLEEHPDVKRVIDLGCGDGHQIQNINFDEYLGFDISDAAILQCEEKFKHDPHKSFWSVWIPGIKCELALSLDVIYHLVEDDVFNEYMDRLFSCSNEWVIIYSSNDPRISNTADHIRHRNFEEWIKANRRDFKRVGRIRNNYPFNGDERLTSISDFFIYKKIK